ncbi:MAG TPA: 2-dehydropantoate 2-reductase [Candidatus Eisenbacteria bacterium]
MAESVVVIGGGALGTLLATRLERAGHAVAVLVRSAARRESLPREGRSLTVETDPTRLPRAALAFVCVKARDTESAARAIAALPAPPPTVCSLQNGWGNLETLEAILPGVPLVAGATTIGAYFDASGALHAVTEGGTLLASWRPGEARGAEYAAAVLESAGLEVQTRPDARAVLWRKLTLNAAVNPLTALLDRPNGALLEHPPLLRVAMAAAGEAALVGIRLGYLPATFDPGPGLESLLHETRGNRSSMAEDVARGRPTEADAILGAAIRAAREAGEKTPVLEALRSMIAAAEGSRAAARAGETPPA